MSATSLDLCFRTESTDKITFVSEVDGDMFTNLVFDHTTDEHAISLSNIHEDDIERGFLFNQNGYRGDANYFALLKIAGKWYDADLISDGLGYPLDLDDDQIAKIVADVTVG